MSDRPENRPADQLTPLVYDELRALAEHYLRQERPDHTLQATALVHEAYMKLVDQTRARFRSRDHFVAVAATAMRRLLVNHALSRQRHKRGGGRVKLTLDTSHLGTGEPAVDLVVLDEALDRLAEMDAPQARIVEMRFFGGLTEDEIAGILDLSPRTVRREWSMARAWLRSVIEQGDDRDT